MKKFFLAFTLFMLLLVGFFIYKNHTGIRNILFEKFGWFPTEEQLQLMKNQALMEKVMEEQKLFLSFAGESNAAWLVKGKLLDPQYADVYAKIKDSIALEFGKSFYFVPQTQSPIQTDARFVFSKRNEVDSLNIKDIGSSNELYKIYAKLVYEGKAEGYRIEPQKFYSSKYLMQTYYFQDKYQNHFSDRILEDVDYDIKEVLLNEFFNTKEGKNFGYSNSNGDYRDYSMDRDFTQSGRDEFAIVLTDLEEEKAGRNKNALIVVAYNPKEDNYYLLYKKMFYDKIKIGNYIYFNDEDRYRQYRGEDEQNEKVEYCIHLLVPNEPERVLRYNKEFDKMEEISEDEFKKTN